MRPAAFGAGLTVVVILLSAGCVQLTKESVWANRIGVRATSQDNTMTESYTEHVHRVNDVIDVDAAGLVEDWDLLWQRDRPTRLTRWHVR